MVFMSLRVFLNMLRRNLPVSCSMSSRVRKTLVFFENRFRLFLMCDTSRFVFTSPFRFIFRYAFAFSIRPLRSDPYSLSPLMSRYEHKYSIRKREMQGKSKNVSGRLRYIFNRKALGLLRQLERALTLL